MDFKARILKLRDIFKPNHNHKGRGNWLLFAVHRTFISAVYPQKIKEKRANIYTKTALKLYKNQKKDGSKKDLA
jgi:hypothetical protein